MIYFFIYLFLEVIVSSSIASSIGGFNTFLEIIISAMIGIFILKNFKLTFSDSISRVRTGQLTQEEFIKENARKAIGAILLIVPGFFTDSIGMLLQFSLLVILFNKIFKFKTPINRKSYSTNFEYDVKSYTNTNNTNYKKEKDEIIDVEIIDGSKFIKH